MKGGSLKEKEKQRKNSLNLETIIYFPEIYFVKHERSQSMYTTVKPGMEDNREIYGFREKL